MDTPTRVFLAAITILGAGALVRGEQTAHTVAWNTHRTVTCVPDERNASDQSPAWTTGDTLCSDGTSHPVNAIPIFGENRQRLLAAKKIICDVADYAQDGFWGGTVTGTSFFTCYPLT